MEDLVTSSIFGTLQHLDTAHFLSFIRLAQLLNRSKPLADLLAGSGWKCDFRFWPWLGSFGLEGCEPDVQVTLTASDQRRVHLLLEMKYLSGKSSFDDGERPASEEQSVPARDQLAREWVNLKAIANGEPAWVLYITPALVMPAEDIEEAQRELVEKRKGAGNIAWLSLSWLLPVIRNASDPWLKSLTRALELLDLQPFEGITKPSGARCTWRFGRAHAWGWARASPELPWFFGRSAQAGQWAWTPTTSSTPFKWRFTT